MIGIKGAELIELKKNVTPMKTLLDLNWIMFLEEVMEEKFYGVEKYKGEIHAVMCFAYTNQIPKSVEELDKLKVMMLFYKVHERSKY